MDILIINLSYIYIVTIKDLYGDKAVVNIL